MSRSALGKKLAQRFDAVFNFLDGDGVAEAQMAFALRAEHRTGNGGDVRLLKQDLRGGAAVLVNLLDVGKGIERARGRRAFQAHFDSAPTTSRSRRLRYSSR